MKRVILTVLAVVVSFCGAHGQMLPDGHPSDGLFPSEGFLDFWRTDGWIYLSERKESQDCVPFADLKPLNGEAQLTAEDIEKKGIDPLGYTVKVDQEKHTQYCVEGGGVLLFYSLDRVEVMYNRALANRRAAKGTKQ